MKRLFRFLPAAILLFFILPEPSVPATTGIKVTDKNGQSLYLYKDYHSLIVGINDYGW
jgi:hypothetical protein